ncbi:MAG: single-stranded DNA-binding protein [Nannocystaceae bacterium]|nr:single-stranded DNA-binding protein [Nannocystaceae bacterium]
MAGINKVILIGNLGRDPELRYTGSGTAVCQLNIATARSYTNKNNERVEETEWHRVTVWSKQAEFCSQYLSKGRQVYVEGRLQTRSYEDKEGIKRYSTDIIADTVQFLGGRGEGGGGQGGGGQGGPPQGGGQGGPPQQGGGQGGGPPQGGDQGGAPQGGGQGDGGQGGPAQGGYDNYIPNDPGDDDIPF